MYDETIQKQVDDLFMALKDDAISTGVDEVRPAPKPPPHLRTVACGALS